MNTAVLLLLLKGATMTIRIFAVSLLCSLPLGLVVAALRMSKLWILNIPAKIFIVVLRGTPLMLQIMFIYFGPGFLPFLHFRWSDRIVAAVVALVLNYSAYFAEIFRGGIEGIPLGQSEAGKVLGLSRTQTFFIIVLPQVIKRILPPLGNEFSSLVKDTSLIHVLGITELMLVAKQQSSRLTSVGPYAVAMLMFLIINTLVSLIMGAFEKKLSYYR
ncbi:MAG: amino acid ABC transporter permease [Oscillospiraceae bacterium]|nr:amino acid ABC transporter permease [Oscillospiraceae bacterium]